MMMVCETCKDVVESPETFHVIKRCPDCGREMRVVNPGQYGRGIRIEEGEKFVIPQGAISVSSNPFKSNVRLTKYGLDWFINSITLNNIKNDQESVREQVTSGIKFAEKVLEDSPLLSDIDLSKDDAGEKILERVGSDRTKIEFWATLIIGFGHKLESYLNDPKICEIVYSCMLFDRSRFMCIYKQALEEVVWMGQSASRLIDAVRIWKGNTENKNEEFWQTTFLDHAYLISQIFAVPIVFIKDKAYVGGKNIENDKARFVNFLCSSEISRDSILVEIKTPITKLLGSKYRGVYSPSKELSGSIVQILDYRFQLMKNLERLTEGTNFDLKTFNPRCAVIIGRSTDLDNDDKIRSFEIFRRNQSEVEIITYDEVFKKAEILARLLNIDFEASSQN